MTKQKRVAAIHDISGFGRCSLTVALPILSAAGIETSVLPTAVLSTHTGGFTGFTYRDLTEDMPAIAKHWKSLDIGFDALYSGFLGSFEQLDIVSNIFQQFKTKENIILVDPVMADNGTLYRIFPDTFPEGMRKLCSKADIIVPNITEALLLLGEPYNPGPYTHEFIETLLRKLSGIGPAKVVLTGVYFEDHKLGVATYERSKQNPSAQVQEQETIRYVLADRIPGYFHGTGDVFASALLSGLLNDFSLEQSARIAVDFTTASIRRTYLAQSDIRYGVFFEQEIPGFIKNLGL